MRRLLGAVLLLVAALVVQGDEWDAAALTDYTNGDYAKGTQRYRAIAEAGNAKAQARMASAYALGLGVPQDYAEAAKWERLAAEQGHADSQLSMGFKYKSGYPDVAQDYVEAHKWFNLVASVHGGEIRRAVAARNRDEVAALMTTAQIAEAQKLAREWKPKK